MRAGEAQARIRINKLLEEAGWRFFANAHGPANIVLEPNIVVSPQDLEQLGDDFTGAKKGFVDFLLLDGRGFPLVVLEAKAESKSPLDGKEQARRYAKSQNCRFVLLSNGNLHYFWDLKQGNPRVIPAFPSPESLEGYSTFTPQSARLASELMTDGYIAQTQMPHYEQAAGWNNETERPAFIEKNKLRLLRPYQLSALYALQKAVQNGDDRFLFEMATGTGKTLTSAAVLKLFLRTANARRALFLVDRLELEEQADKAFRFLLGNDYKTVIYKESKSEWRKAEIVVTTVQSRLFQ